MTSTQIETSLTKLQRMNADYYHQLAMALVDGWNCIQQEIKANAKWGGDANKAAAWLNSIGFQVRAENVAFLVEKKAEPIHLSCPPPLKYPDQPDRALQTACRYLGLFQVPYSKDLNIAEEMKNLVIRVSRMQKEWDAVDLANPIQSIAFLDSIQGAAPQWFTPLHEGLRHQLHQFPIIPRQSLSSSRTEWPVDSWRARYYHALLQDPLSKIKNNVSASWLSRADQFSDFYRSASLTSSSIGWKLSDFSRNLEAHLNALRESLSAYSNFMEDVTPIKTQIQSPVFREMPGDFLREMNESWPDSPWRSPAYCADMIVLLSQLGKEISEIVALSGVKPEKGRMMESLWKDYPHQEKIIMAAAQEDSLEVLSLVQSGRSVWASQIIDSLGLVYGGQDNDLTEDHDRCEPEPQHDLFQDVSPSHAIRR